MLERSMVEPELSMLAFSMLGVDEPIWMRRVGGAYLMLHIGFSS